MSLYDRMRSRIKLSDSVAWESDTLVGETIQTFSNSHLNHISIVSRFMEIDKERVYVLEELIGGAQMNKLSERLESHNGHCWVYPLNPIFDDIRVPLAAWAMDQIGTPYDYPSLFRSAFGHPPLDDDKMICSEYYFLSFLTKMKEVPSHPGWEIVKKILHELKEKCPWPSDWEMMRKHGMFLSPFQIK